jgi:hypothetical protein
VVRVTVLDGRGWRAAARMGVISRARFRDRRDRDLGYRSSTSLAGMVAGLMSRVLEFFVPSADSGRAKSEACPGDR